MSSKKNSCRGNYMRKYGLLHFVAFFHVASLFSTGVDNEKALYTVFPHIVAAATILFWTHLVRKLFKFLFPLCNEKERKLYEEIRYMKYFVEFSKKTVHWLATLLISSGSIKLIYLIKIIWEFFILAIFKSGNFGNFQNFQFRQPSILTTFNFDYFQSWLFSNKLFELHP